MKPESSRNLHLIVLAVMVSCLALSLAVFMQKAKRPPQPPPLPAAPASMPPVPEVPPPPVLPGATSTEPTSTAVAPAYTLSPELASKDGVTHLVLRLPPSDTFATGTWQAGFPFSLDLYGTSTAFENMMSWRLVSGKGHTLGQGSIYVSSTDAGMPGPFMVAVPLDIPTSTVSAVLHVFEASAKDGAPLHEVKVPIRFRLSP